MFDTVTDQPILVYTKSQSVYKYEPLTPIAWPRYSFEHPYVLAAVSMAGHAVSFYGVDPLTSPFTRQIPSPLGQHVSNTLEAPFVDTSARSTPLY
jgi:hypothetical protein